MPGATKTRGDEPPMLLQRPSTGKSQDVRHILARTFRDLFTRDAIAPDTVKNLSVSKGGDDPYHERYVEALQKVFDERQRRMEEAAMLERHIMQAQARAMSADERDLNRVSKSCDNYTELGLPPGRSHFRSCIDTELLRKHKLLTPEDYSTEEPAAVPPPLGPKVPSYARDTVASRQHTCEDLFVPQSPLPEVMETIGSKSDLGSFVSEAPIMEVDTEHPPQFPRNDAWKQQLSEETREQERINLNNLQAKTDYRRNPRFVPPSAPAGGRTLIKGHKPKPKEIGIKLKPDTTDKAKEPSHVFLVSPPAVTFTEYRVGDVYELTLTLKNISACIRQCRALPPSTPFFSIGLGQFPGEHGLVAPGMSCHYAVRFAPDSLKDFDDEIKIQTQSSAPIIVPLLGRRPPPDITLPPVIDVGYCLVGGVHVTQLVVKNNGGRGRFCVMPGCLWPTTNFKSVVHNGNVPIPPFDVRPSVLDIGKDESGIMEIVFSPLAVRPYSVDMCMVCDNCNVRHFTIKGESQRANVELANIERGTIEPLPGELNDATAKHHVKFDNLNPFTYTDRTMAVKNLSNVSLSFQWMIYKPQFDSPGADAASKRYDRVPDVDSVFSVHPPIGTLPASETMEFKITYAPPVIDSFHSVLHLLLNMVPNSLGESSKGSLSSGYRDGSMEDGEDGEEEDDNRSEIILHHSDLAPFTDITALEIEVKGESSPLNVVLHPYAIHVPGRHLVGTTLKKMVTMANHSHSTITFQWEPYTEKYILEVEPPFGELDPGMAMDMELGITGPEPGKTDHTLYCHVMNLDEPLHLKVQAEFKGPELSIDEADINFGLVRVGQTVSQQITLRNLSQIMTQWTIQDSPACPSHDDNNMAVSELTFEPSSGELKPLESWPVTVTFCPVAPKQMKRVVEVLVEEGQDCNVACYAEVQRPTVCLVNCEISIREVYKDVPVVPIARLLNQTLIPTSFEWGEALGDDSGDCSVEMEPRAGVLDPREEKVVKVNFTAYREGDFSEIRIPCRIEGMEKPLILALFCDVKGLSVRYSVSMDGKEPSCDDEPRLEFGEAVELGSTPRLFLHIENLTAISARYSLHTETFFAKPPTPPEERSDARPRAISTRRMMLAKTPNLADPFSKTNTKAFSDLCLAMLSQGEGAAFVASPPSGMLSPFGREVIECTAFSDMWGEYRDTLLCKVGDLEVTQIPVTMLVVGCPLTFQMTASQPDLKPVLRFGTHVAGTSPCHRTMRIRNNSPYDIRVDWEVFNTVAGDQKILDMIVAFGSAFPLRDVNGNEKVPSIEAPPRRWSNEPYGYLRQPSDLIVDSSDSSQQTSRESTEDVIVSDGMDDPPKPRPKVVSVFCRQHHGQTSMAPYNIKPRQLVVPAKGHMSMSVSFTPQPTADVQEERECPGYMLGYLSLDGERAVGRGDAVTRTQGFLTDQLRLDTMAHLKPALLTIECGDEEGMRYRSAMSELLHDGGGLLSESLSVCSVMLSNLTLTPLTFRLVAKKPFLLVDLDPSSNQGGSDRAQSTDMHTLKPRHNLIVKVAFQTTSSLLSEIADDYLSGDDDVSDVGRKVELEDNLRVEFNNNAVQLVPLHATLTVPQFELSKESLDFGTCLVGQRRELQLLVCNYSSSHSQWSISQESKSETCAMDTFQLEPTEGSLEAHITHISDSKALLHVYFTAKHAEDYESVFTFYGILGETPKRLYIRGQGSYDGKHEAILDV